MTRHTKSNSGHHMRMTPLHEYYRGHCPVCKRDKPLHRGVDGTYRCSVCVHGRMTTPAQLPPENPYSAAGRRAARMELSRGSVVPKKLRQRWQRENEQLGQQSRPKRDTGSTRRGKEPPANEPKLAVPPTQDQEWLQKRAVIEKARLLGEQGARDE